MIDYYAIRGKEYNYLACLCEARPEDNRLSLLPNIRFSLALSSFLESQVTKSEDAESLLRKSNNQLQQALIDFPNVIFPLLDRCSIEPDAEVTKCKFFKPQSVPSSIKDLVSLFISRSYLLWKERSVMSWLESNVKSVIKLINKDESLKQRHRQK